MAEGTVLNCYAFDYRIRAPVEPQCLRNQRYRYLVIMVVREMQFRGLEVVLTVGFVLGIFPPSELLLIC